MQSDGTDNGSGTGDGDVALLGLHKFLSTVDRGERKLTFCLTLGTFSVAATRPLHDSLDHGPLTPFIMLGWWVGWRRWLSFTTHTSHTLMIPRVHVVTLSRPVPVS